MTNLKSKNDENLNIQKTNLEYSHQLTKSNFGQSIVFDWLDGISNASKNEQFNIVEVKFKGNRKEFYLNSKNLNLIQENIVVVQAIKGYEIGNISLTGELVRLQMKKKNIQIVDVLKKIDRIATEIDYINWKKAKDLDTSTMYKSRVLAKNLNLKMKICDVEYQGDLSAATFYYTSESRVDFRELILILAKTFNIKIIMRQISLIEEFRRLGGIGTCGREYCFSSWRTYKKNSNKKWSEFKCCLIDDNKISRPSSNKLDFKNIQTLNGLAKIVKKDIDRKIIWFGYSNDDNLIPLKFERVIELQRLIIEGMIIKDLMDEAYVVDNFEKIKINNYGSALTEESITRFDRKK